VRQRIENNSRQTHDAFDSASRTNGSTAPRDQQPKTRREVEEALLNQILDDTQHDIIDVSHLDGMALSTTEGMQRKRTYESIITEHDARVRRSTLPSSTQNNSAQRDGLLSKGGPLSTSRGLLDDVSSRAADWLSRPLPSQELLQMGSTHLEEVSSALDEVKIQHKTDLVVFMDG